MKELPNKYDHKEAEKRWQDEWEKQGVYHWDESSSREDSFVIDTPPPTVSGVLHMGHIYSYTQADFIARYQRMKGKQVFYPMGFDDNGLPTERLVEKVKKVRASDLSREDFIKMCEEVAEGAEEEFRSLFKSVALSVDWNQEYQTISAESRKISQMSFLDLYQKDRAYRKLQPMLWDPVDQTAIAQAEIEDKELDSHENYILFGLENADGSDAGTVEIMTTRPELVPACVAVMCDPSDAEKYKGMKAVTPLFGVKVDIIPDERVDKEKGTGVVMCCTFGDETDIAWWQDHDLDTRIILDKYGKLRTEKILSEAGGKFIEEVEGLKVKAAREKVVELCEAADLLVKREEIKHAVKCAERSGAPLEILPTQQWFVKILDQKEQLKEKANECNWNPDWMKLRIEQWIDGLSWDWCISRQRFFGVPFPVWFSKRAGEEGKILLAEPDQLPVNPMVDLPKGYSKDEVEPELDVMDTWATSSVSPQLSSKGINKEFCIDYDRHQKLFPADLRPQAHEIIRTWAFYTIVKAHLHEQTIPWKNLMISGWCLASDKTKMSKSKGNVVTPVELIVNSSADAVRFWASTSKLGTDTAFSEDVLKIGKKLVNKLWNATKFAAQHLDKLDSEPESAIADVESGVITESLDKWILTRLRKAIETADKEFQRFEYSNARSAAEDFFWNDFCDNYLEMVKARAYAEKSEITKEQQMSAVHTLYHCLDGILHLFAPFVPHITEELYSHIFDKKYEKTGSINSIDSWPEANNYPLDEEAEKVGIAGVSALGAIRKLKAEKGVSIKWPLTKVNFSGSEEKDWDLLSLCLLDLQNVSNSQEIIWSADKLDIQTASEDDRFTVSATFAEESDAA